MFTYSPAKDLLAGRTLLITGASDGIGRVCATTFAEYGADLILLGRSQEKLEQLFDELEDSYPGKATIQPIDFSTASAEDYKALGESLTKNFPVLDGLLHNAGLLGPLCPIEHYPDADWEKLAKVNLNANFFLTKAAMPSLQRSDDGRLVFTASSVGRQGRAYWGAYAVTKFAVEGLMQTMADELGSTSKIRVNSLNPGATRTAMRQTAYPAEDPDTLPEPEALMAVYLYLMGPDSTSIHGQAIDAQTFSDNSLPPA